MTRFLKQLLFQRKFCVIMHPYKQIRLPKENLRYPNIQKGIGGSKFLEKLKYFFSYARKDSEFVLKLAQDLRAVGVNLWLDQLDILGGRQWDKEVEGALKTCRGVIAVLSPESVSSTNVMNEVSYALEEGGLVVPLLLHPCEKPFRLRRLQHIDFTAGYDSGFSQLVRSLGIEQPSQPPDPGSPESSFVREVTEPLDDRPVEPPKSELAKPPPTEVLPAAPSPIAPKPAEPEAVESEPIEPKPVKPQKPKPSEEVRRSRAMLIIVPAGLVLLFFVAGLWWYFSPGPTVKPVVPEQSAQKTITNSLGMKFVLIPKGTFQMGSSLSPEELVKRYGGPAEKYNDEYPLHQVTISKPFYLQTTEVTQGQWQGVMGNNPSFFSQCGKDCPVENVSWNDAQLFVNKLNQLEKTKKYRLPTEAEWEYACHAGSTSVFYFGDDSEELGKYAWYGDNSKYKTYPVGRLKPNAWGLYDILGNVYEWCQDWKGDYPDGPVTDPKGPSSGKYRVLRGGSYVDKFRTARSAVRGYRNPDRPLDHIGFRVARDF